jgi:hypothetical protein
MIQTMKRQNLQVLLIGVFLLLMTSNCREFLEEYIPNQGAQRKFKLKEFINDNRRYTFYYNQHGNVDSIVAQEGIIRYAYVVQYNNGRIDSVSTIDNGELISIHNDFQYDSRKRIIRYNYRPRVPAPVPPDVFFPYVVTYDAKSRIQSINTSAFTYDNRDNIIQGFDATFTYDHKVNPLHFVTNLFALFVEETFLWEFILSKHNATSRKTEDTELIYQNEYDAYNRLIRKKIFNAGGQIGEQRFTYYD